MPRNIMPSQREPLDLRLTILADDEPSPAYLALWRRLLAPLPTPPSPKPCVAPPVTLELHKPSPARGKVAGDA
jgi:hypothetical protein